MKMRLIGFLIMGFLGFNGLVAQSAEKINWISWDDLPAKMQQEPRKIFVDVYTDWCGWCKKMDASTFANPAVVKYMNVKYYCVKFNAETRETVKVGNKEYSYVSSGSRGYNQLAYELLGGRLSYPTTVYLNEKLEILSPVPGYLDVSMMTKVMKYFGDNAYLDTDWETYSAQ